MRHGRDESRRESPMVQTESKAAPQSAKAFWENGPSLRRLTQEADAKNWSSPKHVQPEEGRNEPAPRAIKFRKTSRQNRPSNRRGFLNRPSNRRGLSLDSYIGRLSLKGTWKGILEVSAFLVYYITILCSSTSQIARTSQRLNRRGSSAA